MAMCDNRGKTRKQLCIYMSRGDSSVRFPCSSVFLFVISLILSPRCRSQQATWPATSTRSGSQCYPPRPSSHPFVGQHRYTNGIPYLPGGWVEKTGVLLSSLLQYKCCVLTVGWFIDV